jgi:hypothetical protein
MAQGITGFAAGRASPSPVVRLFSVLIDRREVAVQVDVDGKTWAFEESVASIEPMPVYVDNAASPHAELSGPRERVPLIRIAHGRSGDKGDMANIGIIARSPAAYALLLDVLTADVVRQYFEHVVQGPVTRYALPGFHALNFTLDNALGGGGIASLRYDPQGKAFAQMLLDIPLDVPTALLETLS